MKKIPLKKTSPKSAIKRRAWKALSEWIRQSHADSNGMLRCYTCGHPMHWKESQAGHGIPKALGNAIYWCEDLIRPQCYRCNINLGGWGEKFIENLTKELGESRVTELRQLRYKIQPMNALDYEKIAIKYEQKLSTMPICN